ncbi:sensor histidine kinase [Legionella feeleii]|nr:HAMP domain-containing sensor histidine kinase [Legionella feeleii]
MSELIIFDFSLLCLVYSENSGLSLLLFGLIALISGDIFVNYSFLSQTTSMLKYGELLWFLGLLLILFGLSFINKNKKHTIKEWFSQTNTIKNRLAFWTFSSSILSFLLFIFVAYFFSAVSKEMLLGLPFFAMMYSVVVVIFSIYVGKRFELPFKKLTANIEALMLRNDKSKIDENFSTQEFIFLQKFIIDAFELQEKHTKDQKDMLNQIVQAAHDIRSPLAAITTATSDVSSVPESKRIMIRNAAKRINDIANNLLFRSKNHLVDSGVNGIDPHNYPELIFAVLDNIVTEKKYEHYSSHVHIALDISFDAYNSFSNIHPVSFKRLLSNLINNSIEAIKSNGSVVISLACNASHVSIVIEDNGCGIPSEILPKITSHGFSFNKESGAGIGLSYAKEYLDQINGKMSIYSEEKIGTRITIDLIRSNPPDWFCDTLKIRNGSTIVILDDDNSIHDVWEERLKKFSNIKISHCYNAAELYKSKTGSTTPILYLVDYELVNDVKSGLDIIEELNLGNNAILVTSCFEDSSVRTRCNNLGSKILPKPCVPYIKIAQIPTKRINNIIYIDDDDMMRTAWMFAADEAGESIFTYSSFDAFMVDLDNYNKDTTVIYIDSDLESDIRGEICAKTLFDKGFTEIYLATGYSKDRFSHMSWIKSVVGKEPPFQITL